MSPSILLCGEGGHEFGKKIWSKREKASVHQDGWMQAIVIRILPDIKMEHRSRKNLVILPRDEAKFRPLPAGHGKKSLLAKIISTVEKHNAVIYMVDADSVEKKHWKKIIEEIKGGFDAYSSNVIAVTCVPMSASESWLLADPNAWDASGATSVPILPPNPEKIWGDPDDPSSNRPHRLFARICIEAEMEDDIVSRHDIAKHTDLDRLRQACPISFPDFMDQIQQVAEQIQLLAANSSKPV